MAFLSELLLTREQMDHLPLSIRKIYYNDVTDVEHEMRLYKYSPAVQDDEMRESFALKPISKMIIVPSATDKNKSK